MCTEIIDRIDIVFHLQVITYLVENRSTTKNKQKKLVIQEC